MLKQQLAQKQQLKLLPQQLMLVKLLEATTVELDERVIQELESNPALEESAGEESNNDADSQDEFGSDQDSGDADLGDYRNEDDIPDYKLIANNRSKDEKKEDIPFSADLTFHDSTQLLAAEHYIDSAFRQKNLFKLALVPKVSIFLYRSQMDEGRRYVAGVDAALFPRPYLKEMYLHFFDALIFNKSQQYPQRDESLKKAIASVEDYLKIHPKDKDGISDYFSLKMYSEPSEKLLADMDAYSKKCPDSKAIVDNLKRSLTGVIKKSK